MIGTKIVIGSDHGGLNLKNFLYQYLKDKDYNITDIGVHTNDSCDYPDTAFKVAEAVSDNQYDKGILVCGTGLGMAIAANKVKGIRAITCSDCYSARMSVEHNNANILTLGERVIGQGLAVDIVDNWLNSNYDGGRHQNRLNKINNYEKQ